MLSTVASIEAPSGRSFLLTSTGQLFRETTGSVKFLRSAEDEWREEWGADKEKEADICLGWRQDRMPTLAQTSYIYRILFSQYKHEVICWYGLVKEGEHKGKLAFYIPKQLCRQAYVSIEDGEENAVFAQSCRILGDMHSHPWPGQPRMSGTDSKDMMGSPGIHAIFSSTGLVSWYGSARGCVAHLTDVDVAKVEPEPTLLLTNKGVPIEQCISMWQPPNYGGGSHYIVGGGHGHYSQKIPHHYQEKTNGKKKKKRNKGRDRRWTLDRDGQTWIYTCDSDSGDTGTDEYGNLTFENESDQEWWDRLVEETKDADSSGNRDHDLLRADVEIAVESTFPDLLEHLGDTMIVMLPREGAGFIPMLIRCADWPKVRGALHREGITRVRGVAMRDVSFGECLGFLA